MPHAPLMLIPPCSRLEGDLGSRNESNAETHEASYAGIERRWNPLGQDVLKRMVASVMKENFY
jgi:hypothetical protein